MINKVKNFIETNKLNIDNRVVCAVSGGADSVVLISILSRLGYKCILAHVNHHKRKESEEEERAMRKLAEDLNVPFELLDYHFKGNGNFHDDSHNARYDFFRAIADKYNTNIIATAHHEGDQIETILIKLMEGSNLYGYGGIALDNNDGKYRIIRPLLCVNKNEIYDFAKEEGLTYFEDSSNHKDLFLRNRLRHHVVPLLLDECPDLYDKALRYSLMMHEAFDYIREDSINYLNKHNNSIDISSFKNLRIALKKDIISLLLERFNIRRNTNIINDILELLENEAGNKELKLEGEYFLYKEYNQAYISKQNATLPTVVVLEENDSVVYNNAYRFYFSKNLPVSGAKYIKLWYNQLIFPFVIRPRKKGDTITIDNGTKKVSRVMIDKKIPKNQRDILPIITDGNGDIVWIYDILKSDSVYKQKSEGNIYLVCEVL